MKEARYYTKLNDQVVRCALCPHRCRIQTDERGDCKVRLNGNSRLIAENYGWLSAIQLDPIEKKPLYHFYPGKNILSVGSIGCNMHCGFCQNCDISQATVNDSHKIKKHLPEDIAMVANDYKENLGIAFTYNEPAIYYEWMLETARMVKSTRLKTVMVSNGFISENALAELMPYIDAFNIDLKFFSEKLYRKHTGAYLKPVLNTLLLIKEAAKHLEISHLVIPTLNDNENDFKNMLEWIVQNLGNDIPFHLSRYFPAYNFDIQPTSPKLLLDYYKIAREYLPYTYTGNINHSESSTTYCRKCNYKLIDRLGYRIHINGMNQNGHCNNCGEKNLNYLSI